MGVHLTSVVNERNENIDLLSIYKKAGNVFIGESVNVTPPSGI
jgi:hypothetical protein